MKRIWLQNESDKLFADRQWCEDKVWDDEDCTAGIAGTAGVIADTLRRLGGGRGPGMVC